MTDLTFMGVGPAKTRKSNQLRVALAFMARIDAFLKLGMAQGCSDLHLADSYAWLADMSHPSAGSNMAFWDRESSQTTYVHSYGASRRPVPFVAETSDAVARGILIACGLLEIGGKRIRSLLDDMALTSELAFVCNDELLLGRTSRPSRNDPCPCGSGRKFKACGHDWGKPALPTTGVMPSFTVTGFGICQAQ